MILTKVGVGTVKTPPPGIRTRAPFFSSSFIDDTRVVVRPSVIWPTVVGSLGRVAALEKQVVTHDEDDVALQPFLLGGEFAKIDPANPIVWNLKFHRWFPFAFTQAAGPIVRFVHVDCVRLVS